MLADTWTGGDARPAPYCKIQKDVMSWVELSFLEGELPGGELLAYEAVVRGLPKRFETDPEIED